MSQAATAGRAWTRSRWWYIRGTVKVMAAFAVGYFIVIPLIPGFQQATHEIGTIQPAYLASAVSLEIAALFCYSMLTRAMLPAPTIPMERLFRIQLSTKAVSGLMPGGSAAGSALGYRLLTLSGVRPVDAGFALAGVGLVSAVVLNALFFTGLFISIPLRGVNPFYASAAAFGVGLMMFVAGLVVGIVRGESKAQGLVRWVAKKLRFNPDRAERVLQHVAERLRILLQDRRLLCKAIAFAALNWLLDAAALWMFLRAMGGSLAPDGLIIAFCLANIAAVVPITPGGLGIVEGVYIPTITWFGLTRSQASIGVLVYRVAQYWLPMLLGALAYVSLRVGPWSIERRDRLAALGTMAHESLKDTTDSIEWAEEYGTADLATDFDVDRSDYVSRSRSRRS